MASLIRCDGCKKLSDEPGVGHIGKTWEIRHYRDFVGKITLERDLCEDCVKKSVAENNITKPMTDY